MKNLRITLLTICMMAVVLPVQLWSQCTFCPSSETDGSSSSVLGFGNSALGASSTVIGYRSEAHAQGSIAIGKDLVVSRNYSIVIGSGKDDTRRLINNIPQSLMIGFDSEYPTFFVSPPQAGFITGRIGIGNVTSPQAKLHIRGDAGEDADLLLEPGAGNQTALIRLGQNNSISARDGGDMLFETETDQAFVFENGNMGIGTSQPEAKLHISGDLQVGDTSQPQNVRIYGGINGSGDYASSFGDGNTASGNYSFVAGRNSQIISTTQFASHYSNIIGSWSSIEKGPHSNIIGSFSQAMNDFSFTFGTYNKAKGSYSFAIGSHVEAWSGGSFVIGNGLIDAKLINSVPNSLMIGFNSAYPTLFVSRTQLDFQSGRVGIGNITDPQAKLHIRADEGEDATIMLESTGTGKHARMFFTGEHHITASNGDDFKFRTTDESNFVFQNGDIFMEDINTGIIMKSPNGQCWRGTLNDQGVLVFAQTDCPDQASSIINLPTSGSEVKIYPNPTNLSITIESLNGMTHATWRLSALDSTTLASGKINSDKTEISLLHFVAGVYVLTIEHNGRTIKSEKVVKQ